MRAIASVALDLVREAASRKWFLALGLAITALLVTITFGLSLEVVDGALAATRLFGEVVETDIVAADVAMRPLLEAASYVIFYVGLAFGILACSDFGPGLLSPGRIEHLLSLPLTRASLITGTYAGVLMVISLAALYGAAGFTLIVGAKTGVWTVRLLATALLAALTFAAIYGAMLSCAVFVRSAAVSASAGAVLFGAGIISGYREDIAPMFTEGLERSSFELITKAIPPVSTIADAAAHISGSEVVDTAQLGRTVIGMLIFGCAWLAVGLWHFERKDF